MATLREAADAIINRAEAASAGATAEDLVYLAKATEAVGVTSVVGFINATSEMQNARVLTTGAEQNARVIATGDAEVARVIQTMGSAVGVLTTKGDLLVHTGSAVARVPGPTAKGQVLTADANNMPVWSAFGKVRNIAHYQFWDISRVTWSGYGNIFSGSDFFYKPLKDDSKLLVMAELSVSSNGNWSGAEIMWCPVNAGNSATEGWRYGPGPNGERYNSGNPNAPSGFDPWATFGGAYSQFGNTYNDQGWNQLQKYTATMLIDLRSVAAFDAAQGHKIWFAMTGHAQGSWMTINENYNQSATPSRYATSGYTVFELAPTANTAQE